MIKYKILTVCGTGIVTSTVVSEKCKELLKERGIEIEAMVCKVNDAKIIIPEFMPDIIIHTVSLSENVTDDIRTFCGLQLLTGQREGEFADEISQYLKHMDKRN